MKSLETRAGQTLRRGRLRTRGRHHTGCSAGELPKGANQGGSDENGEKEQVRAPALAGACHKWGKMTSPRAVNRLKLRRAATGINGRSAEALQGPHTGSTDRQHIDGDADGMLAAAEQNAGDRRHVVVVAAVGQRDVLIGNGNAVGRIEVAPAVFG